MGNGFVWDLTNTGMLCAMRFVTRLNVEFYATRHGPTSKSKILEICRLLLSQHRILRGFNIYMLMNKILDYELLVCPLVDIDENSSCRRVSSSGLSQILQCHFFVFQV
jgi:hypothetical protein